MLDSKGVPGWDRVNLLARELLSITDLAVRSEQADIIIKLYNGLDEFDKKPLVYQPRYSTGPARGRFGRTKHHSTGHVGLESVKRCTAIVRLLMY